VKIEENSKIQTTRALSVEVEKIGDIGETADLLEILFDPADIFLNFVTCAEPRDAQCGRAHDLGARGDSSVGRRCPGRDREAGT
jgi:hypothetical protein